MLRRPAVAPNWRLRATAYFCQSDECRGQCRADPGDPAGSDLLLCEERVTGLMAESEGIRPLGTRDPAASDAYWPLQVPRERPTRNVSLPEMAGPVLLSTLPTIAFICPMRRRDSCGRPPGWSSRRGLAGVEGRRSGCDFRSSWEMGGNPASVIAPSRLVILLRT